VALNGAVGIELSRKHRIDVLVLDFDMEGMNGDEVAAVFMKEQPKLPVVISTGSLDEVPASMKWFADALVQKGDGPEALLSAIENVMAVISNAKKSPSRELVTASNKRIA
jgi:DNA-binding NarL/FixJ family response regulator